jgi:phage gpG-like protein
MAGARISFTLDDKGFDAGVQKLGGVLRTGTIRAIGVALVEVVNQRFESAKDPFGQKWAGLLPAYALIKKGPGILRASGMLQRSITFTTSGSQVTVGSNRIYAAVHQFGATIKAKTPKGLAFSLGEAGPVGPRGGKSKTGIVRVHVQSVTVPQRPYLGFGPNDQRAVMDVIAKEIATTFGG